MTAVQVLSTTPARRPRLLRGLGAAGFLAEPSADGVVAVRSGVRVAVGEPTKDLGPVSEDLLVTATRLFGRAPRCRTPCRLDSAPDEPGRAALVDVARAVAACVPLAVLDDGSGTAFLVHPQHGLVGPEDYLQPAPTTALQNVLRSLLERPR